MIGYKSVERKSSRLCFRYLMTRREMMRSAGNMGSSDLDTTTQPNAIDDTGGAPWSNKPQRTD